MACLHAAMQGQYTDRLGTPVQVPTTLMAAIDASIGIKTAVNFDNRKNKLGTYCPPLGVFIDRSALRLHAYWLRCVCLHRLTVWYLQHMSPAHLLFGMAISCLLTLHVVQVIFALAGSPQHQQRRC